jgi:hypothetical protein
MAVLEGPHGRLPPANVAFYRGLGRQALRFATICHQQWAYYGVIICWHTRPKAIRLLQARPSWDSGLPSSRFAGAEDLYAFR